MYARICIVSSFRLLVSSVNLAFGEGSCFPFTAREARGEEAAGASQKNRMDLAGTAHEPTRDRRC